MAETAAAASSSQASADPASASSADLSTRSLDAGHDVLDDAAAPDVLDDAEADAEVQGVDAARDAAADGARDAAEAAVEAGIEEKDAAVAKADSSTEPQGQDDIPPGVDVRKEAYRALNRGKPKDAVRYSRAALAKDPSDAMLYLYLGSALQDLGKVKEARKIYSECVHKATKGPKQECRMMGGR